jgi:hypothetical protein
MRQERLWRLADFQTGRDVRKQSGIIDFLAGEGRGAATQAGGMSKFS